jgi:hypothetical protein
MEPLSLRTAIHNPSLGTATVNTLNALYHLRGDSHTITSECLPTFIPSATTLVALDARPPDGESREFMRRLTSGAQATAISNFYDSILAGPFSEESNGEFTDVGLWLGSGGYQRGREMAVLASLGLGEHPERSAARVRAMRA